MPVVGVPTVGGGCGVATGVGAGEGAGAGGLTGHEPSGFGRRPFGQTFGE